MWYACVVCLYICVDLCGMFVCMCGSVWHMSIFMCVLCVFMQICVVYVFVSDVRLVCLYIFVGPCSICLCVYVCAVFVHMHGSLWHMSACECLCVACVFGAQWVILGIVYTAGGVEHPERLKPGVRRLGKRQEQRLGDWSCGPNTSPFPCHFCGSK